MPFDDLGRRAELHATLGEPARLAIIDSLRVTDRSPAELAGHLDMSTNLLAHHLGVLERVGLIERIVSDGDRRRRYISLRGQPLVGLLPPLPSPASAALFVCTHNSARSQLAAAMWTARLRLPARSAGTHPADRVHPRAVAAGRRAGLDLSTSSPHMLNSATDLGADTTIITVCDRAHEELEPGVEWWHWSIPDPVEGGRPADFDDAVHRLDRRMAALLTSLDPVSSLDPVTSHTKDHP